MTALLPLASFGQSQTLTVNDGTGTNAYVPLYGYNGDHDQHNQMLYPASTLTGMNGKAISKMVFYIATYGTTYYTDVENSGRLGTWTISLGETSATTLSALDNTTPVTQVYSGTMTWNHTDSTLTITFASEYVYGGGNLLVDFSHAAASWNSYSFKGVTTTDYMSYSSYYSSSPAQKFLPKTTFTYGNPPSCPKPKNFSAPSVTDVSATLKWGHGGSETAWTLEYGTSSTFAGATSVTVTDTFKNITGLTENTLYYARVKAVCTAGTDESEFVDAISFKTSCGAYDIYTDDFSDYTVSSTSSSDANGIMPDCWDKVFTGTASYAPHLYNGSYGPNYSTGNADNCLIMSGGTYVLLPLINNLGAMQISFSTAMYSTSGTLTLGYMTNTTAASFTALETIPTNVYSTTRKVTHEFVLAAYDIPAGARLAFKWDYTSLYAYCCLDDIAVTAAPACKKPGLLACVNSGARSATLSWKPLSGESSWTLEYSTTSDFSIATTTAVTVTTDTFKLITGLTPNTTYYARVKANCTTEESSDYSNPITFKTIYGFPFVELFNTSSIPADWTRWSGAASSAFDGTLPTSTTSGWTSNTYALGSYNYKMNISSTNKYWLVTPNIDLSGTTSAELNFDLAITDGSSNNAPGEGEPDADDEFMVIISTDNGATWSRSNATTWGTGADYDNDFASVSHTGDNITIDLNEYVGGTVKIAFYGGSAASGASFDVHVDNIFVQVPPTCFKPTHIQTVEGSVHARTATIEWEDNNTSEPQYGWLLIVNDTVQVAADENPFTMNGLTPETNYKVKVRAICDVDDTSDVSISVVSFTTTPSCPNPKNLTVVDSLITTTSAIVTWTPGDMEDTWIVNINRHDTIVDNTRLELTGLTPATNYTVKVRAFCDVADSSEWVSKNFDTKCEPVVVTNNLLFSENFNTLTAGIPICWDNSKGDVTTESYKWNYHATGYSGACVRFNSYYTPSGQYNFLKTPVLNLTAVTDPKLSFTYKYPSSGSGNFSVYVSTDGGNTYSTTALLSTGHVTNWTTTTIPLENLAAYNQVVILFKGTSDCGYNDDYIYLDDVEVGGEPTCFRPIEVAVPKATIATTSAIVHWTDTNATAPANGWTVRCYDGEHTLTVQATDTFATLSPLTAATRYTVQVMSNCGTDDESAWTDEIAFETKCEAFTVDEDHIYTEGFEDYEGVSYNSAGVVPNCWESYSTGSVKPHVIGSGNYYWVHGGTKALTFYGSGYCYAMLPEFSNAINDLQISFWMQTESASYGTLTLGYISAGDENYNTFEEIKTYENHNGSMVSCRTFLNDVPDSATRLVFRWYYSGQWSCCIDDIQVSLVPACMAPTALQVDTVTAYTATIHWVNVNDEDPEYWTVQYQIVNDTVKHTATSTDTVIVLENLVPEKNYIAKVKANCNPASESEYSGTSALFTTTPSCLKPTNLAWSDLTATSVTLDWTVGDAEELWVLNLNGQEILVDTNHLVLDTLRENTDYTVKVAAYCSADDTSYYTSAEAFSTPCIPVSCEGYTENFNTGNTPAGNTAQNGTMPSCWDQLSNATVKPHVYKGQNYSPRSNDTCIIISSSSATGAGYAIMPPLTGLNYKQITFATAMNDTTGVFALGYMTDIRDASTFTMIEAVPANLYNGSNRYAEHTLELVNIPDGARLAFKWECNGSSSAKYACFDDVVISDGPSCVKPTDLYVSNITASNATITWNENNPNDPENGWIINLNGADTAVNATTTFTFDNLMPTTNYTVMVRSACSDAEGDTSAWSVPYTFVTPCAAITAQGYTENFGSYTFTSTTTSDANGFLPDCWDYVFTGSNSDYKPHLYNGTYSPRANNNCIVMTIGGAAQGSSNLVVMPTFDTLAGKWMTFATAMQTATNGALTIGYVTSLDPSTFVMIDTIPNNYYSNAATRYVLHEVFVNTVPEGARIAFKWAKNGTSNTAYSCCIDDIKLENIPSCIHPISVEVPEDSITTTTAWVYWTDRNTEEPEYGWTIKVNDDVVAANTNPFQLTGLNPSSTYTVKVQANCDTIDASEWSEEVTFYTDCGIGSVEGFSENFNDYTAATSLSTTSGILPRCWDAIYTGTTTSYAPHILKYSSYSPTASDNCVVLAASSSASYGSNTFVVLPEFVSLAGKQITFAAAMSSSTIDAGTLTVGYITSATTLSATSFTALETVPYTYYSSTPRYVQSEVLLNNVPAGSRIAFKWSVTGSSLVYCCIDDIVIEDIPSCMKPISVVVPDTTITGTTAVVHWTDRNNTEPANGWTISYNGTTVAATTNPFTLTGLTPSTAYTVKVKANCGAADESDWSNETTFHTACAAVASLEEDFEGYSSGLPMCWENLGTGTIAVQTTQPHSGSKSLRFSGATGNNIVALPEMDDYNGKTLTFYTKPESSTNSSCGSFSVGYITNTSNTSTFQALATYQYSDADFATYAEKNIDLSTVPAGARLAFRHDATSSSWYWFVDDINIPVPCAAPTNVTVDSNYVVRWEGSASRYNVMVMVGNDTVATGTSTTGIYSITSGLNDGDQAIVYVQAVCADDDLSVWTASEPFTYGEVGVESYTIHANIFPNPTTGNVTVESNAIGADLNVYDMFGKLMMTTTVASERTELDFSGFAPGVYVVRIANSKAITTVKVVKE